MSGSPQGTIPEMISPENMLGKHPQWNDTHSIYGMCKFKGFMLVGEGRGVTGIWKERVQGGFAVVTHGVQVRNNGCECCCTETLLPLSVFEQGGRGEGQEMAHFIASFIPTP
jgi:hypothetical protein